MFTKRFRFHLTLCVVVIMLLTLSLAGALSAAESNDFETSSKQGRMLILNMAAYYGVGCLGEGPDNQKDNYSNSMEKQYLNMNEEEFKKALSENVLATMTKIEDNKNLYWNERFVETVVKNLTPHLYSKIAEQQSDKDIPKDPYLEIFAEEPEISYENAVIATAGEMTKTFTRSIYNVWGNELAALKCRMEWGWNSSETEITFVYPSTWGECYAPLWSYEGLVSNSQRFVSPAHFRKYVKGLFQLTANDEIIQSEYPWIEMDLYPDFYTYSVGG